MIVQNPGVQLEENASLSINNISNDVAFFGGFFEKGEIGSTKIITNPKQFKNYFGRANKENYNDWYQCYNYLQYSNNLLVQRTVSDSMNSYVGFPNIEIPTYIENYDDYLTKEPYITLIPGNYLKIIARTPGSWGNIIEVQMFTLLEWENNEIIYGTTRAKDILLSMEEGDYCFTVSRLGQLVETHNKSFDTVDEINTESNYIYIKHLLSDYHLLDGNFLFVDGDTGEIISDGNIPYDYDEPAFYGDTSLVLGNGYEVAPTQGNLQETYDSMNNIEDYQIDIVIGNERDNQSAITLAETRKDCIAFIGTPHYTFNHLQQTKDYVATLDNSEYTHVTANYKYQYDGFTDSNIWVNLAGDTAGLKAQASNKEPWSVNAGLNNGIIKNVQRIMVNFKKPQVDALTTLGVNTIKNSTLGVYLNSQRTFTNKPSSFNRINIRALFNYIERSTKKLVQYNIFNSTDFYNMNNIKVEISKFLEFVKSSRGIEAFKVVVTPNKNEIIVDIYIKPLYVAEFIQLRMINLGTKSTSSYLSSKI